MGMDVHRSAHRDAGMQVLCQIARPGHAGFARDHHKDLGEHRLKDMKYPTPIYQLVIDTAGGFSTTKTKFSGNEALANLLSGRSILKRRFGFVFGRELLTAKLEAVTDTNFCRS
jgi:hypothetical protein